MKKSNSQKQLIPSFKEMKEHASFYIPVGLLLLLFSSFVYNVGYFLLLDVKLLGLLTISDYYEGTVPYIIIFSAISLIEYIVYLYLSSEQHSSITTIIASLFRHLCTFFRVIYVFYKYLRNKILLSLYYRKRKNSPRKLNQKKLLIKENEHSYNELKKIFKKNLFNIILSLFFILILMIPLIGIFINLKIVTVQGYSFVIICLFILWMFLGDTQKGRRIFTVIIILLIVWMTGFNSFKRAYDNKNIQIQFINDNKTYNLIRVIANGYIVRHEEDVYFFSKENLLGIKLKKFQQKEQNNDTK